MPLPFRSSKATPETWAAAGAAQITPARSTKAVDRTKPPGNRGPLYARCGSRGTRLCGQSRLESGGRPEPTPRLRRIGRGPVGAPVRPPTLAARLGGHRDPAPEAAG